MRTSTVLFLICLLAIPALGVKRRAKSTEELFDVQAFHNIVHEKDLEKFQSIFQELGDNLSSLSQNEAEAAVNQILEHLGQDVSDNYSDEEYQALNELAHGANDQLLSERREHVDEVFRRFDFAYHHLRVLFGAVRPSGVDCPLDGTVHLPVCPKEEAQNNNSSTEQPAGNAPPSWIQLKSKLNPEEFKGLIQQDNVESLYEQIKDALGSLGELPEEEASTQYENFVNGVAESVHNYSDEEYLLLGNLLQGLAERFYEERKEALKQIKFEFKAAIDFLHHTYDALKPEDFNYTLPGDNETEARIEHGKCKQPEGEQPSVAEVALQIRMKARKFPPGQGSGSGAGQGSGSAAGQGSGSAAGQGNGSAAGQGNGSGEVVVDSAVSNPVQNGESQNNASNVEGGDNEENHEFEPITNCFRRPAPAEGAPARVLAKLRKHKRHSAKHHLRKH